MIMININNFIQEKLKINSKSQVNQYKYQTQKRAEFLNLLKKLIKERGNNADLNDIDVSKIDDMNCLFYLHFSDEFNGDISGWDVSNVTDMHYMFKKSKFNGNISNWNVSNVTNMTGMFEKSKFNGDISTWNVNVKPEWMNNIFKGCKLEKNPPKWYHEKS